eukprot:TRINITY_DN4521_c0_g1_i5.p1 TRINITY_DN4521_c0_g1~~TRINITY_DN4521_c0_g1_i5.p1  ORF type:complete len:1061 (-),score=249.46 TRINITY_DN4521_c0_g1_i5:52-3135(-)
MATNLEALVGQCTQFAVVNPATCVKELRHECQRLAEAVKHRARAPTDAETEAWLSDTVTHQCLPPGYVEGAVLQQRAGDSYTAKGSLASMKGKEFAASASLLGFEPRPLHLAALYDDAAGLKVLLARPDTDVNAVDNRGWTALHYAARYNRPEMIKQLLTVKADHTRESAELLGPVHEAARCGNVEALQAFVSLLSVECLHSVSRSGFTPLHYASKEGRADAVRYIVSHVGDADQCSREEKKTALHVAASSDERVVATELIRAGSNVNSADAHGVTPLMAAAQSGCADMAKLLMLQNADPSHRDENGKSALHHAVQSGNIPTVTVVAAGGAARGLNIVNAADDGGRAPIAEAILRDDAAMVRALVTQLRAEPNLRDADGHTPLTLAASVGAVAAAKSLVNECGVSPNQTTLDGDSALLVSLDSKFPAVAEVLLKKGATVTVNNSVGLTPLHMAAQHGYAYLTKELIKQGAIVDATDANGDTPLHYAVVSNPDCAAILVAAGANVVLRSRDGTTPLQKAAASGVPLIVPAAATAAPSQFERFKQQQSAAQKKELGPTSAAHSFADGPGLAQAARSAAQTFTVFARDANDNFRTASDDNFAVNVALGNRTYLAAELRRSHTSKPPLCDRDCDIKLACCGDGTYVCTYLLDRPGRYSFHVLLNGDNVANSPIDVEITAASTAVTPALPRIDSVTPAAAPDYGDVLVQWVKARGAPRVELALACDATYSMDSVIDMCKTCMLQIIDALREDVGTLVDVVRVALVLYGDHPPQGSTFVTKAWDLTTDYQSVQRQIASIDALGGGDNPEAVEDALQQLTRLAWSLQSCKVAMLIGDAPPHGAGDPLDAFPHGCPLGIDYMVEAEKLKNLGVTVHAVVAASGPPVSAGCLVKSFAAVANTTGGKCFRIEDTLNISHYIKCQAQVSLDQWILREKVVDVVVREHPSLAALHQQQQNQRVAQQLVREGFTSTRQLTVAGGRAELRRVTLTAADVAVALQSAKRWACHACRLGVTDGELAETLARYAFVSNVMRVGL